MTVTLPDGRKAHQWHPAFLFQGMRQHGEDGPVTLRARQGETVMQNGDWVIENRDGSRDVMRRPVAEALRR